MKKFNKEKIIAQLTKYYTRVIVNASINYFKKVDLYRKNELLIVDEFDEGIQKKVVGIANPNASKSNGNLIMIFDEKLESIFCHLKTREQVLLIEKYVLEKTDREIGQVFKISRQGVTNLKRRTHTKLRKLLGANRE